MTDRDRKPHRGPCEKPVEDEPAIMPQEAPIPIKLPEPTAIPVPNWPVKDPSKVSNGST